MSKVTIGHDSCSAWTCGSEQGPSELGSTFSIGLAQDMQRSLTAPFLPVYWLYKGAKAASKSIRSSR